MQYTVYIYAQHCLQVLPVRVCYGSVLPNAGISDQRIQPAEAQDCSLDRRHQILWLADIARDRKQLAM